MFYLACVHDLVIKLTVINNINSPVFQNETTNVISVHVICSWSQSVRDWAETALSATEEADYNSK